MATFENQMRKLNNRARKLDRKFQKAYDYLDAHPEADSRSILEFLFFQDEDLSRAAHRLQDAHFWQSRVPKKNRHHIVVLRQRWDKKIAKIS